MFKPFAAAFAVTVLAGIAGCSGNGTGTAGGEGGNKKEQFHIEAWHMTIDVKKGQSKETEIAIKRGTDFKDAVSFKFEDNMKGLTFDPAEPRIDSGSTTVHVKIHADANADAGEHTIKVTGTPAKVGEGVATNMFKVKVTD